MERRLYYEFLWETGVAQSDAAQFCAEQIDWPRRILAYQRQKTGSWAHLQIGRPLEELLRQLPANGFLFGKIARTKNSARSAEFRRRCRILKLNGISLHSYRYAWAERAQSCGYPERWAQNALGHNSRAIHQAYAKGGVAICPPLDDYERIANKIPVAFAPVEEVPDQAKPIEGPVALSTQGIEWRGQASTLRSVLAEQRPVKWSRNASRSRPSDFVCGTILRIVGFLGMPSASILTRRPASAACF